MEVFFLATKLPAFYLSNSHPCLLETHKATTAKGVKRMEM